MLSKKLSRLVNKLALVAIIFASIAPSISHALAAQQGTSTFAQEVCTANGKKITIQVLTSKGQQLATQLVAKDFGAKSADKTTPAGLQHHLQHCPFCSAGAAAAVLPNQSLVIIELLEIAAQKLAKYAAPTIVSATYVSPPSQAPPNL